ncbi:hypothetical protein DFQ30_007543 [Apophysomyces sp. BC1015]|nr:hypothetical protein DFQ30_007543 [Apophysomyces sp. BC1015]KAG0180954.1 hypothetical protein DFQ29_009704 [Apophysomyces sp. BC1021]
MEETSIDIERREFEDWKRQEEEALSREIREKNNMIREREAALKQTYEEHNKQQTKKRVELYDVTFQAELEDYRRRRETEVSSLYSLDKKNPASPMTATLESLQLEEGSNSLDLDNFLSEDVESKSSPSASSPRTKIKTKPDPDSFYSSDEEDTGDKKRLNTVDQSLMSDDEDRIDIMGDEDYEDI